MIKIKLSSTGCHSKKLLVKDNHLESSKENNVISGRNSSSGSYECDAGTSRNVNLYDNYESEMFESESNIMGKKSCLHKRVDHTPRSTNSATYKPISAWTNFDNPLPFSNDKNVKTMSPDAALSKELVEKVRIPFHNPSSKETILFREGKPILISQPETYCIKMQKRHRPKIYENICSIKEKPMIFPHKIINGEKYCVIREGNNRNYKMNSTKKYLFKEVHSNDVKNLIKKEKYTSSLKVVNMSKALPKFSQNVSNSFDEQLTRKSYEESSHLRPSLSESRNSEIYNNNISMVNIKNVKSKFKDLNSQEIFNMRKVNLQNKSMLNKHFHSDEYLSDYDATSNASSCLSNSTLENRKRQGYYNTANGNEWDESSSQFKYDEKNIEQMQKNLKQDSYAKSAMQSIDSLSEVNNAKNKEMLASVEVQKKSKKLKSNSIVQIYKDNTHEDVDIETSSECKKLLQSEEFIQRKVKSESSLKNKFDELGNKFQTPALPFSCKRITATQLKLGRDNESLPSTVSNIGISSEKSCANSSDIDPDCSKRISPLSVSSPTSNITVNKKANVILRRIPVLEKFVAENVAVKNLSSSYSFPIGVSTVNNSNNSSEQDEDINSDTKLGLIANDLAVEANLDFTLENEDIDIKLEPMNFDNSEKMLGEEKRMPEKSKFCPVKVDSFGRVIIKKEASEKANLFKEDNEESVESLFEGFENSTLHEITLKMPSRCNESINDPQTSNCDKAAPSFANNLYEKTPSVTRSKSHTSFSSTPGMEENISAAANENDPKDTSQNDMIPQPKMKLRNQNRKGMKYKKSRQELSTLASRNVDNTPDSIPLKSSRTNQNTPKSLPLKSSRTNQTEVRSKKRNLSSSASSDNKKIRVEEKVSTERKNKRSKDGNASSYYKCNHCSFSSKLKGTLLLHSKIHPEKETLDTSKTQANSEEITLATSKTQAHSEKKTFATPTQAYAEKKTFATPKTQAYAEKKTFATPKTQAYAEKKTFATPKTQAYAEKKTFATPKTQAHAEKKTFATPKTQAYAEKKTFATPKIQAHAEKKTFATSKTQAHAENTLATSKSQANLEKDKESLVTSIVPSARSQTDVAEYRRNIKDKNKPFNCNLCGYRSTTSGNLFRHFRTHKGFIPYQCMVCKMCFSDAESLKTHITYNHTKSHKGRNVKYTCYTCFEQFPLKASLDSHKRLHHAEDKAICPLCSLVCHDSVTLKYHMKSHGSQSNPCFECSNCDYKSDNIDDLILHIKNHNHQQEIYSNNSDDNPCEGNQQLSEPSSAHSKKQPETELTAASDSCPQSLRNEQLVDQSMRKVHTENDANESLSNIGKETSNVRSLQQNTNELVHNDRALNHDGKKISLDVCQSDGNVAYASPLPKRRTKFYNQKLNNINELVHMNDAKNDGQCHSMPEDSNRDESDAISKRDKKVSPVTASSAKPSNLLNKESDPSSLESLDFQYIQVSSLDSDFSTKISTVQTRRSKLLQEREDKSKKQMVQAEQASVLPSESKNQNSNVAEHELQPRKSLRIHSRNTKSKSMHQERDLESQNLMLVKNKAESPKVTPVEKRHSVSQNIKPVRKKTASPKLTSVKKRDSVVSNIKQVHKRSVKSSNSTQEKKKSKMERIPKDAGHKEQQSTAVSDPSKITENSSPENLKVKGTLMQENMASVSLANNSFQKDKVCSPSVVGNHLRNVPGNMTKNIESQNPELENAKTESESDKIMPEATKESNSSSLNESSCVLTNPDEEIHAIEEESRETVCESAFRCSPNKKPNSEYECSKSPTIGKSNIKLGHQISRSLVSESVMTSSNSTAINKDQAEDAKHLRTPVRSENSQPSVTNNLESQLSVSSDAVNTSEEYMTPRCTVPISEGDDGARSSMIIKDRNIIEGKITSSNISEEKGITETKSVDEMQKPQNEDPDSSDKNGSANDRCGLNTAGKRITSESETSEKSKNILSFKCNFCSFKAEKLFLLNNHLEDHSDMRPFECSFCPQTFSNSWQLKMHIKEHDDDDGEGEGEGEGDQDQEDV